MMRKSIEIIKSKSNQAKNGSTRVQIRTDGAKHLEVFQNGSWRHDNRCKSITNKECQIH